MTEQAEKPRKLTRRKQRFADEYLTGCTGAEALRRIGHKGEPIQLARAAYKWVHDPAVAEYLNERRKDLSASTGIRPEQIARELALVGFANLKSFFNADGSLIPITALSDDQAAALAAMEIEAQFEGRGEARVKVGDVLKVKTWNKVEALEKLAKLLGFMKDKLDIDLNAPPPVIQVVPYEDADDAERAARAAVSGHTPAT